MNRRPFIERQGATCRNWAWSWSFVNHEEKFVIFGAWDINEAAAGTVILDAEWELSEKGRRQPGYRQAREHVGLVEQNGYRLFTFPMSFSQPDDGRGTGPAKIKDFVPTLTEKDLQRRGDTWYAVDNNEANPIPEEVVDPERFIEGSSQVVSVNSYERNPRARDKCIEHYGYCCVICNFDFEESYGDIGTNYIHVHHVVSLSKVDSEYEVDPINDLVPVCPNCHAMIHRRKTDLTIEEVRDAVNRHVKMLNTDAGKSGAG